MHCLRLACRKAALRPHGDFHRARQGRLEGGATGFGVQNEARIGVITGRQMFTQVHRWIDQRQTVAAALFACVGGHRMPMLHSGHPLSGIQPDHTAFAEYGDDAPHTEFGGLLDHEIHALAPCHGLHQSYPQRRFAIHRALPGQCHAHAAPAHAVDLAVILATISVEQDQGVTAPGAQHAGDVCGGGGGQIDPGACCQRTRHMQARGPHFGRLPRAGMRREYIRPALSHMLGMPETRARCL